MMLYSIIPFVTFSRCIQSIPLFKLFNWQLIILKDAVVVVDDCVQASIAGEINVPVSKGTFSIDDVYATLSEIVIGNKLGRTDNNAISVFDSTGVAIEDMATAKLLYEKAIETGRYISMDLV